MIRKPLVYFLLLLVPVAYSFIAAKQDAACPSHAAPDRPGDTLPVDSSLYLPSVIGKKFPKRKDVAHVYGYAHLFWTDLMSGYKSKKYFQLTNGLKVLQYKDSAFRQTLSPGQIDELYALLNKKSNFRPKEESSCFFPRHTFLFCNADNKVIGRLEICFECDQLRSNPHPASRVFSLGSLSPEGEAAMEAFCGQAGLTTEFRR